MNGRIVLLLIAAMGLAAAGRAAADGPNMLTNGDFTETDEKGMPKHWGVPSAGPDSGSSNVHTSLVEGPHGKPAVRIECTESATRKTPTWIILRQDGTVKARKGQRLYVSLWLKQEGLEGGVVSVWLMRLKPWGSLCAASTRVTREWQKMEFVFRPSETCDNARFEVFFTQTGTLYLADVHVAETTKRDLDVSPIRLKMLRDRKPAAEKNAVWNGSFEAGIDGWGTEGFDHNVVKIDGAVASRGKRSARIDLDKNGLPVGYSDYPKAREVVFASVQLASSGWTRFEPGERYTLSVDLKSNRQDLEARMMRALHDRGERRETCHRHGPMAATLADLHGPGRLRLRRDQLPHGWLVGATVDRRGAVGKGRSRDRLCRQVSGREA